MRFISGAVLAIVTFHAAHAIHHNPHSAVLHHAMMMALDRSISASGVPNGLHVAAGIRRIILERPTSAVVGSARTTVNELAY